VDRGIIVGRVYHVKPFIVRCHTSIISRCIAVCQPRISTHIVCRSSS
jgi:hypothetical protein